MDIGFGKKENRADDRQDMDIGDMRGSLRKLEQTIESLSTRLDAVERRLSDMDFEGPVVMDTENRPSPHPSIRQLSKKINSEITQLQQELQEIKRAQADTHQPGKAGQQSSASPTVIPAGKNNRGGSDAHRKKVAELERKMEVLEGQKATVQVGRIEIPLEISGIVGGMLAFLIAALLFQGHRGLVASPAFVASLGVLLVIAAACKTYLVNVAQR